MKIKNNSGCNRLVECASTIRCSTSTWDFFALQIELVVVGDLFVFLDFASRVDDDFLVAVHCDYFCITIWLKIFYTINQLEDKENKTGC